MVTAVDVLVVLLVVLTVTARLGPAGWLAGVAFAVIGWAALADGLRRYDVRSFGAAGRFALARAVLVGGVDGARRGDHRPPAGPGGGDRRPRRGSCWP